MLKVADDLTSYTLGAGEPFLLQIAFLTSAGQAADLTTRAFVLSFYKSNRENVAQLSGEIDTDVNGAFLRFERDGEFTEGLFNQTLKVELAERFQNSRNVIASGNLNVSATALLVPDFSNAPIGAFATRVTIKESATGGLSTFSQHQVAYAAAGGVPVAPTVVARPSIATDGTPQVGETMAGQTGSYLHGSVTARAWLMGTTVLSSSVAYAPTTAGSLVYRETVTGAGGTVTATSDPVTVVAVTPPAPTINNTSSDSTLPGSAVSGFMPAAQAVVDLINSEG